MTISPTATSVAPQVLLGNHLKALKLPTGIVRLTGSAAQNSQSKKVTHLQRTRRSNLPWRSPGRGGVCIGRSGVQNRAQ